MYSTIKAGWFFAVFALCIVNSVSGGCPRCAQVERDRAQEQSENPQKSVYYDEFLKQSAANDMNLSKRPHESTVADNAPSAKSVDPLTNKDVFEENDVKLPPYQNEDESKDKAVRDTSNREEDIYPEVTNPHAGKGGVSAQAASAAFSTIHNVLDTRDLLSSLAGPFTLFVPSDKAFSVLPAGFLQNLLKPENADKLRLLVSNHVVPKQILKSDFIKYKGLEVKSIGGRNLTLNSDSNGLTIDGAKLLSVEPAGNAGTIYIIDRVLL